MTWEAFCLGVGISHIRASGDCLRSQELALFTELVTGLERYEDDVGAGARGVGISLASNDAWECEAKGGGRSKQRAVIDGYSYCCKCGYVVLVTDRLL